MNNSFYPLQFEPILKHRIWGGEKLKAQFNKPIVSKTTGESWELSTIAGDISVVSNGDFKGKLITDLIDLHPNEILGSKVYKRFGTEFPLLFKFLDAKENLSIQVHPNDELAKKRHNSFGKTEMWYVMQADDGAEIIVGFKENATQDEYLESLGKKKITSLLNEVEVHEGEVFFLETGTVHSIGAGIVIAEIQQTSDVTYRIYDFDRRDENGEMRELHTDLALDAINYHKIETQKIYFKEPNTANPIVDCPYFTTNFIPLTERTLIEKSGKSFTVYMCVDGNFTLTVNGSDFFYKKGDTVLIPAELENYYLSGTASILEIYIS